MVVSVVKHNALISMGDYPFADSVKKEFLFLFKNGVKHIAKDKTNVSSYIHTSFYWEENNIVFRNLKSYIQNEIEKVYKPCHNSNGSRRRIKCKNFWGMAYKKGDYARKHNHYGDFSFLYFVKGKWFHSPLVFSDTGKRIRPKEGRYVIFPAYMYHHVPTHRYNDTRMTISGNFQLEDIEE